MEDIKHHYFCVLCGESLYEIGLGFLQCKKCKTQFLPTMRIRDEVVPPGQHLNECCLSWIQTGEME